MIESYYRSLLEAIAAESLIFRYDDTPHFPDLPNFPHHKHIGHSEQVISATAPDLTAVLQEIELGYPLDE